MKKTLIAAVAVLLVFAAPVFAKKPITDKETQTIKATIDSIDHSARLVTLKDKDGNLETLQAGPEIKRFDELKVGDQVTFKYTESIVYQLRKAGEPAAPSSVGNASIVRNPTAKPSGTMTQQETMTVTVKAVDMKRPGVTIQTEDGRTMSFKVEDKGRLKGVNPGDRVVITYTQALLISVD
jgi:Cu/Ag efflux protein CusF